MNTILQLAGYEQIKLKVPAVTFGWSWEDRAWGYTTTFAELGWTSLILGPFFIEFDWGI